MHSAPRLPHHRSCPKLNSDHTRTNQSIEHPHSNNRTPRLASMTDAFTRPPCRAQHNDHAHHRPPPTTTDPDAVPHAQRPSRTTTNIRGIPRPHPPPSKHICVCVCAINNGWTHSEFPSSRRNPLQRSCLLRYFFTTLCTKLPNRIPSRRRPHPLSISRQATPTANVRKSDSSVQIR